jgi:DNA helicase-2/ATP-dependent DNA helicase PcrA
VSTLKNSLEEERRLMYVAMTLAKKHLTLSMAKRRKRFGKDSPSSSSRFLFEIPKEILKVSLWDQL